MAKRDQRVRLMFDFESAEGAAQFVDQIQDLMPVEVGAYQADILDFRSSAGGISTGNSYVIRGVETASRDRRLTYQKEVTV